jgi:hypothetical protein
MHSHFPALPHVNTRAASIVASRGLHLWESEIGDRGANNTRKPSQLAQLLAQEVALVHSVGDLASHAILSTAQYVAHECLQRYSNHLSTLPTRVNTRALAASATTDLATPDANDAWIVSIA